MFEPRHALPLSDTPGQEAIHPHKPLRGSGSAGMLNTPARPYNYPRTISTFPSCSLRGARPEAFGGWSRMRRPRAGYASQHPGGSGAPPAWPLRAGCEELADGGANASAKRGPEPSDRPERAGAKPQAVKRAQTAQACLRWSVGRRSVLTGRTRRKTRTEGWCAARRSTSPRFLGGGSDQASGAARREHKSIRRDRR